MGGNELNRLDNKKLLWGLLISNILFIICIVFMSISNSNDSKLNDEKLTSLKEEFEVSSHRNELVESNVYDNEIATLGDYILLLNSSTGKTDKLKIDLNKLKIGTSREESFKILRINEEDLVSSGDGNYGDIQAKIDEVNIETDGVNAKLLLIHYLVDGEYVLSINEIKYNFNEENSNADKNTVMNRLFKINGEFDYIFNEDISEGKINRTINWKKENGELLIVSIPIGGNEIIVTSRK